MEPRSDIIKELVTMVLASAKYRRLSPDLVRTIGAKELAKGRSLKDAVKATKNKLHQVAGMYLPGATHYGAWLAQLTSAFQSGDVALLDTPCGSRDLLRIRHLYRHDGLSQRVFR